MYVPLWRLVHLAPPAGARATAVSLMKNQFTNIQHSLRGKIVDVKKRMKNKWEKKKKLN